MGTITLIRVYEARRGKESYDAVKDACTGEDAPSVFLVDRLWPRGIAKTDLPFDAWVKEAGPSTELRKWFGHDPERFEEFTTRYSKELEESQEHVQPILDAARDRDIVLLFSAKDTEHNQAVVLRRWINSKH